VQVPACKLTAGSLELELEEGTNKLCQDYAYSSPDERPKDTNPTP